MKQIAVNCDRCGIEVPEQIGYEIIILRNQVPYAGTMDEDMDQEEVNHVDLCEACYSKFYINFLDLVGEK